MQNNIPKLNDKIKYIKRTFKTPYHFFYMSMKNNLIGIRFEDKAGQNFNFTGPSMFEAVLTAERYVNEGLKEGNLKEYEPRKKTTELKETII